jgi:nucleoside 2-deoxyribosyltransferase
LTNKVIYLIGALKNENVPVLAEKIRKLGYDVFDDWYSAGPEADSYFNKYRLARGLNYKDALKSYAAQHIFNFDHGHLDRADIVVLVMPAGKSGHLELGYSIGRGKIGYILFDKEPERLDQMHQFADEIFMNEQDLLGKLKSDKAEKKVFSKAELHQLLQVEQAFHADR